MAVTTKRSEHMEWCKSRAREYIAQGDLGGAVSSMMSDLRKHPETEQHAGILLGGMLMMGGHLSTVEQVTKFVEGFN